MQQAYVVGATETELAKAADAAKSSDLDGALPCREPPPASAKRRPMEKGENNKGVQNNDNMDALADVLLTPINEKMAPTDL